MQNIQPTNMTPQPFHTTPQTPAEKLLEAGMLVARAFSRADDEATDWLSWRDREVMSRQLHSALRLMREAREALTPTVESLPVATCLECGELMTSECLTCAYMLAVSH